MKEVRVNLRPIVSKVNTPTVIKTAVLPGDTSESLFIATQVGEIFNVKNGDIKMFLDIRAQVIQLGTASGGYDERGLLGLAFHPEFSRNGLFYVHYSVAGSQGPGAQPKSFMPDPCDPASLNLKWTDRVTQYNHIDTVEEWALQPDGQLQRMRTLLNIRQPFMNHNGVNSLNFSPENNKLVFTNGDGGSGYDPFNLGQDIMEVAGKIIEFDLTKNISNGIPPAVSRFDELPPLIQEALAVMVKGTRNPTGIAYQKLQNQYIKYVGNVGQDLEEAVYAFIQYNPLPVTQLVQAAMQNNQVNHEGMINLGWRGWEGAFPTAFLRPCSANPALSEKVIAFYDEAIETSLNRLHPIVTYYHDDPRPDKFSGISLTAVQPYLGTKIPQLSGALLFSEWARVKTPRLPIRGALGYTHIRSDFRQGDFGVVETNYDFGTENAYYVSLGTNLDQTRLFLGVYGSARSADLHLGTVFEIMP